MKVFDQLKELSLDEFAKFLLDVLKVDGYFDNEFCGRYCKYRYKEKIKLPGKSFKWISKCRLKECKYGAEVE